MAEKVEIVEVGPRDGLQNLSCFIETRQKVDLIRHLASAGLQDIQVGGFVSPRAIPQFGNIAEVSRTVIESIHGVRFNALVPNVKGAVDALSCGIRHLSFVFSVSEAHNKNNVGKTPEESLQELAAILDLLPSYRGAAVTVDLATTFGCPFIVKVPEERVLLYVQKVHEMGVRRITLCDTVGFGNPRQVQRIATTCLSSFPDVTFRCHFHNTRGLGCANALAAYELGIESFDTAIGGLGGCPFAPGATGNTATEDMAFMFSEMGVETGISIPRLLETVRFLREIIPSVKLESSLARAGLPGAEHKGCSM
ncbi:MAG: hydroxymethylglutaryl-CoA lyase [Deltaproteobacteria bacterium]|nr:hydroxymethylglutaryl-CoA lyase [Deltaproteobacteria bacterium]